MTRHRHGELREALEPVFAAQRERLHRPWFAAPEFESPLAGEIAALMLSVEPAELSGTEIARRLRRRKVEVLAALRSDPHFVSNGSGRSLRWRVASGTAVAASGNRKEPDTGSNASAYLRAQVAAGERL
jgi:hypothetical protein